MAELHIDNKGWKYQWSTWEDEIIKEYYPKNGYEKVLKLLPNRKYIKFQELLCHLQ